MHANLRFSVAIPAYKATFLDEAIISCLSQTYTNLEVVIVDDHSPENLKAIVYKYKDPRIRYYRNETNCGAINVVDNWNICLKYCTGDYVICMGDDDCLVENCLAEYAKLIAKYPNLGVYHAWTEIIDEDSEYLTMQQPRPEWESCLSLLWNRWNGRSRQYIGDFCFDRKRLVDNGGFIKFPLAWASDDISAVYAAKSGGIANTQRPCFRYRQNRRTITSTGNVDMKMDAILAEKEWYQLFINEYSESITDNVPCEFLDVERKYLKAIQSEMEQHFREKYKILLQLDMREASYRVIHWIRKRRQYGISVKRVVYAGVLGLLSRGHGL